MPSTLSFHVTHNYADLTVNGITVPIQLSVGARNARLHAKLDTGAEFCIFGREHGEALGLNIEAGDLRTFSTVTGNFTAYGHEVTIACFEWQFNALVYFPPTPDFPRNVLGRNGWIQNFRLAIIDYDRLLHLSHYNQSRVIG